MNMRIAPILIAAILLAASLKCSARIGVEYQMQLGNPTEAKPDCNKHVSSLTASFTTV